MDVHFLRGFRVRANLVYPCFSLYSKTSRCSGHDFLTIQDDTSSRGDCGPSESQAATFLRQSLPEGVISKEDIDKLPKLDTNLYSVYSISSTKRFNGRRDQNPRCS